MKVEKLNIAPTDGGVNLDVDGAPEGIHLEWKILPQVLDILTKLSEEQN
ncbi:hypothetical protein [Corynebacterium flavescens]|nr:hypothetical protein [Corynebacterium flavescens]MDN6199346.1 hypothetical protein [Corynebacterium flavescens]MDN6227423.1 hypothetical protein [Corynebacterium flavescens]